MKRVDVFVFCLFLLGALNMALAQEGAAEPPAAGGERQSKAAEERPSGEDPAEKGAGESATSKPSPSTKELPPPDDPYAPALKVVGGLERDFGEAEKGDVKKVSFTVTNTGAGILKLTRAEADCGCLEPKLSLTRLEKGQSSVIEVIVTTSIIEGEAENKHIILFSNDARYPNGLQFHVKGKVVSTIGLQPTRIVFDKVSIDSRATSVIEIFDVRNYGLKIEDARTTSNMFAVNTEPATVTIKHKVFDEKTKKEEEKTFTYPGYRLEVSLTDKAQVGRIEERLVVTTNYEPRKRLPIRITGSIVSEYFTYKPTGRIYLGGVRAGRKSRTRTLVVTSLDDDFAVGNVDVVAGSEDVQTSLSRKDAETRIKVWVTAGRRPGPGRALLTVYREGQDDRPIITIPVMWRVRGAGVTPSGRVPDAPRGPGADAAGE